MASVCCGHLRSAARRLRARRAGGRAKTPFEVCLGAILTQNTAWTNVERALAALRRAGCCRTGALRGLPPSRLAPLIRSSGTYNVKARRVAAFVGFLGGEYGGRVAAMAGERPLGRCAQKLLARARDRARDGRLDRPLRRGPAAVRRRRLHAPGLRAPGLVSRARGLRRGPALLHGLPAARRRRSSTTTMPRSCASARRPAERARCARGARSRGSARNGASTTTRS